VQLGSGRGDGVARVEKKLQEVADGVWAYTQLPGSWGWSNAGLVAHRGESLLVDTLFDLTITAEMLERMRRVTAAAERIGTVVNTHGNGDHCYGNALVADATIVGTRGTVRDLEQTPPRRMALLLKAGRMGLALGGAGRGLGRWLARAGMPQIERLLDAAALAIPAFQDFEFPWTSSVVPNRTFEGSYHARIGDKRAEVVEVGPAHTRGDAFVYVPDERVVFTGDLLFKDAHPIVWEGPVTNWVAACRRLLALDAETVVPGHGPITDKSGIEETLAYLELLTVETRARYEAGMPFEEAVLDLAPALDDYRHWSDSERVYVNVHTLYRDLSGNRSAPDVLRLFAGMARIKKARERGWFALGRC
jgi:cyclase